MNSTIKYLLGFTFGLLGTLSSALAMSLQKRLHNVQQTAQGAAPGSPRGYYQRKEFLAGITLMIFGAIMSILQLSFLTQSESAGLAALTLVWNVLLSRAILGERYSTAEYVGTAVVASGTAAAVTFKANNGGSHERLPIEAVMYRLSRPAALIGASIVVALIVLSTTAISRSEQDAPARGEDGTRSNGQQPSPFLAFLRTFTSGLFAGCSGLATKCLIEAISAQPEGTKLLVFSHPLAWCLLLAIPCSIVTQVAFLNGALRRHDAKLVVPIYQGMLLLTGVSFGQLFLMESAADSPSATFMLWASVAISLGGIGIIFAGRVQPELPTETVCAAESEEEQQPLVP